MERRSLYYDDDDDNESTPTQEDQNVFDDQFEVWDGIGDGMYADGLGPGHDRRPSSPEIRSIAAHHAPPDQPYTPTGPSMAPRNSIRKSRSYLENPFQSPEDEAEAPLDRAVSMHSQSTTYAPGNIASRSMSSASSSQFAQPHSPRIGGNGPTHPYGMYPQGTMPRTPSVLTSSTARPAQRQEGSSEAPQHPYALYPQGVDEDNEDDDADAALNPVPLGFPGHGGQQYQRRRGPDGEEQDIIGVDGHMEQLPPYSRFPEEGHTASKMPLLAAPTPLHSRGPVAGSDPTMPLMHDVPSVPQQERPRPQSMMDESELARSNTQASRRSRASGSNLMQMQTSNSFYSDLSKKSWKEKSWKEKRKTKFCGCIPFWWILLSLGVLVFIAAVLGGVIGGFFGSQDHHQDELIESKPTTTETSLYDASRIPTPTALAPPTGTFQLELGPPEEVLDGCLTGPNQANAWGCNIGGPGGAAMVIGQPPGMTGGGPEGAYLIYDGDDSDNGDGSLYYGVQGCSMETDFAQFIAVQDNDAPDLGPAFYFQQMYNKVVVVPEDALDAAQANFKRDYSVPSDWLRRRQIEPLPSDTPWMCFWNNTFIEAFIYLTEIANATTPTTSSPAATTSPPNTTTLNTATPSATSYHSPTSHMYDATAMITKTVTFASTTSAFTGPASEIKSWVGSMEGKYGEAKSADAFYKQRRQQQLPPTMPYVVKIEERRVPSNTIAPYCQQLQILDNGSWNWIYSDNGSLIRTITLNETDPSYANYQNAGKFKRGYAQNACHCQWMSGQGR